MVASLNIFNDVWKEGLSSYRNEEVATQVKKSIYARKKAFYKWMASNAIVFCV